MHPNYTPSSKLLLFLNPIRDSPNNNLNFWVPSLTGCCQTSIFKLHLFIRLFVYFHCVSLCVEFTPWPPAVAFLLPPCRWNMEQCRPPISEASPLIRRAPCLGPAVNLDSKSLYSFLYSFWDSLTIQPWLSWHLLCRAAWPWTHRDWPTSACWVLGLGGSPQAC